MILKKKVLSLALVAITIPVLALATCSIIFNSDNLLGLGDAVPMEINGTSTKNRLVSDDGSASYTGSASVQTERGNSIGIDYSNILITDGAWHTLNLGSTFNNTTALHGLSSMVITVADNSANLGIYWSKDSSFSSANSATYNSSSSTTITCDFASYNPNYFKVMGLGSNSIINSIVISFSCENSYPSLTIASSDTSKGTVSDSNGQYLVGTSVTVTATPANGYTLSGWYYNDSLVSSSNPYTFSMPSTDYFLIALFRTPIVGESITFGSYPQSKVSDTSLISTLNSEAGTPSSPASGVTWSDYNYYINGTVSSYMWFTDITNNSIKYRGVYFTSYRPYFAANPSSTNNSNQDDNGYLISTTYWFKYEPLSWRVLSVNSGKYLLMSNSVIDAQDYYYATSDRTIDGSTVYANNYKYSHIRSWLNGYTDQGATNSYSFIDQAFSTTEQTKIQTTEVDNSAATTNDSANSFACANTNDKLFLLSYKDTINTAYGFNASYSNYDAKRQLKTTDYCQSQGGYTYSTADTYQGNGCWRLRSPYGSDSDGASSVYSDGYVDYYSVYSANNGVAPAMWLTL